MIDREPKTPKEVLSILQEEAKRDFRKFASSAEPNQETVLHAWKLYVRADSMLNGASVSSQLRNLLLYIHGEECDKAEVMTGKFEFGQRTQRGFGLLGSFFIGLNEQEAQKAEDFANRMLSSANNPSLPHPWY